MKSMIMSRAESAAKPLAAILMILLGLGSFAQDKQWKTGSADGGRISVRYSISERSDGNGGVMPLIEYVSTATEPISFQKCVSLVKDVSMHKAILDAKSSEILQAVSESEWLVYYAFDGAGPFPASDCVATMTYAEGKSGKTASFNLSAAPNRRKATEAKRFTCWDRSFEFKDLGDGKVEIALSVKMSPAFKVPLWMIRTGFPGEAINDIRLFVKLAKEG